MGGEKPSKIRIVLTLTKVYVDSLDRLVEKGLYMGRQAAIRAALRRLFLHHKIEPFTTPKPPEDTDREETDPELES